MVHSPPHLPVSFCNFTPAPAPSPHWPQSLICLPSCHQSWRLIPDAKGLNPRASRTPTHELALHYPPAQLSAAIDRPWPE